MLKKLNYTVLDSINIVLDTKIMNKTWMVIHQNTQKHVHRVSFSLFQLTYWLTSQDMDQDAGGEYFPVSMDSDLCANPVVNLDSCIYGHDK